MPGHEPATPPGYEPEPELQPVEEPESGQEDEPETATQATPPGLIIPASAADGGGGDTARTGGGDTPMEGTTSLAHYLHMEHEYTSWRHRRRHNDDTTCAGFRAVMYWAVYGDTQYWHAMPIPAWAKRREKFSFFLFSPESRVRAFARRYVVWKWKHEFIVLLVRRAAIVALAS